MRNLLKQYIVIEKWISPMFCLNTSRNMRKPETAPFISLILCSIYNLQRSLIYTVMTQ